VLVATGSAARVGCGDMETPVDACVVGIVDDPEKIVIVE
jgi:ethanolamine utilization protein EutN